MEVIKTSSNVEFEVIYADGTRKRVQEGVLCEAAPSGKMILHNGTGNPAVWLATTETLLVALYGCKAVKTLAKCMLISTGSFAAAKEFAETVNALVVVDRPAVFRLGQMDLQQCAADMLKDYADEADGLIASTLRHAAELVRGMEIPGGC